MLKLWWNFDRTLYLILYKIWLWSQATLCYTIIIYFSRDTSVSDDVVISGYDSLPASALPLWYKTLVQIPLEGFFEFISRLAMIFHPPQFCVYYLWLTFMSFLMIPLSLARPCCVTNAVLGAKLMVPLSALLGLDWKVQTFFISNLYTPSFLYSFNKLVVWLALSQVRGETDLLKRPEACVVVANHQSSIDLLGMFVIWGKLERVAALAKQSLVYYGSFGITAFLCGTVFVDR